MGFIKFVPAVGNSKYQVPLYPWSAEHWAKIRAPKLSGWTLAQNRAGETPIITAANIENIISLPLPSVTERALGILQEAERGLEQLGDTFNSNDPRFLAASYSSNSNDVNYLLRMLSTQEFAKPIAMGGMCEILPLGFIQLDGLRRQTSESSQGFVAMWFNESMDKVYSDGFQDGILRAGYSSVRMDRIEHVNKIDDEIIQQLKASKFVVADFTSHRGGVYFEAGFALGFDIPVFWTCRKDHMNDLHFDIRQFNCIDWETPEELSSRLSTRLEAVLGLGPNR